MLLKFFLVTIVGHILFGVSSPSVPCWLACTFILLKESDSFSKYLRLVSCPNVMEDFLIINVGSGESTFF